MVDEASVLQPGEIPEDALSLDEIVGQDDAVQRLKALVELARSQGRPLPHILLVGRPGAGKRTVAMALAKEMGPHGLRSHASPFIGTATSWGS